MGEIKQLRENYRYIPNFITQAEEEYLLRKISETPQPKWKNVTNRRLQVWGGHIVPGNTLLSQPLPSFLTSFPNIIGRLATTGAFDQSVHKASNHVLVNEYQPGEGIMPHEDGPSYHPVVATISLGSHTLFHYHRYKQSPSSISDSLSVSDPLPTSPDMVASPGNATTGSSSNGGRAIDPTPVISLLLEPRSVIITSGALYKGYLHGIEGVPEDTILGADEEYPRSQGESNGDNKLNYGPGSVSLKGYRVDNWEFVEDEKMRKIAREGGVLKRSTRVSLTCRDVEKTRKVGLPGFGHR